MSSNSSNSTDSFESLNAESLFLRVKELEEDLSSGKEKISLLLSSLPIGLIVLDEKLVIDVANKVVQEMLGYARVDIACRPISILLPGLSNLDETKKNFETKARKSDGNFLPVEVSFTRATISSNRKQTFLFITDVSERYEIEKLKRDFVAMISHDLRAPLTHIMGVLDLLSAGEFGEISDQGLTQINNCDNNLNRLLSMISDLLEIEKLENQLIMDLNCELANLTMLLKEALVDIEFLRAQKSISISCWQDNVFGKCDKQRIYRVLVNLISNAIKFSPSGSTVSCRITETDDWLEISVTDQGIGVPEPHRHAIFDKYSQILRADTPADRKGTGLGLAICKTIVEAHGGSIGVKDSCDSDADGCTFWFRIPCVEN